MSARRGEHDGDILAATFVGSAILDYQQMKATCDDLSRLIVEHGSSKMLLNFRNVQDLNSGALGALITFRKKLLEAGCRLVLCNLDPHTEEVFELTKLDRLFSISREDPETEESGVTIPLKPLHPSGAVPVILPFPTKEPD
jgi:anti-anti-sigma factor